MAYKLVAFSSQQRLLQCSVSTLHIVFFTQNHTNISTAHQQKCKKIPPKRSITNAHATKEQKLRKAVSRNRAVFDFGGLFCYFFGQAKK